MASLANDLSASLHGSFSGRLSDAHSRHGSLSISDMARVWHQGNRSSLNLRPSRASSVISTRTKTSIGTAHDELREAVDVHVSGGVVYRLGLDGRILSINLAKGRASSDPEAFSLDGRDSFPSSLAYSEAELGHGRAPADEQGGTTEIGRSPSFTPGRETLSVTRRRSLSNSPSERNGSSRTASADSSSPPIWRRKAARPKVGHRESSGLSTDEAGDGTPRSRAPPEPMESSSAGLGVPEPAAGREPLHFLTDDLNRSSIYQLIEDFDRRFKLNEHEAVIETHFETQQTFSNPFRFGHTRKSVSMSHVSGSSSDMVNDTASAPAIVATGPVKPEESLVGDRSPPPMDSENDISIHYSRIIRSIDASHRSDIEAREQELAEARDLLGILARQAVDIKAELIRTKGQMAAMSDPAHLHKMGREETIEAQSFSFPPLKLKHVRTLKLALKRRAEKMRKGMDDDLGWLLKRTTSAGDDGPEQDASRAAMVGEVERPPESVSGKADPPPHAEDFDGDEQAILQSLLATRRQNRALEAEKRILESQVVNLRESITIWRDRYHDVERRRQSQHVMTHTPELSAEVAKVRREVEEAWLGRWRDRNDQLAQRMRRIDEDAQRSLQQAVRERDAWIVRCADLSNLLKQRDEELAQLKQGRSSLSSIDAMSTRSNRELEV